MTTLNTIIEEENTPDTEVEKEVKVLMRMIKTESELFDEDSAYTFITHLISSRDTYWKERVRKWVDENEYCSKCCSPKEYCMEWGEHASAIDTNDLLQALDNLK